MGQAYRVAREMAYSVEAMSEMHSISGQYDLMGKFYLEPEQDIGLFVVETLQTVPGVKDTYTIQTFNAFPGARGDPAALKRPRIRRARPAAARSCPNPTNRLRPEASPGPQEDPDHAPRLLTAPAAGLFLAGCQNPNGSTNWGSTLLLGAGIGAAAALIAGAPRTTAAAVIMAAAMAAAGEATLRLRRPSIRSGG